MVVAFHLQAKPHKSPEPWARLVISLEKTVLLLESNMSAVTMRISAALTIIEKLADDAEVTFEGSDILGGAGLGTTYFWE